MIKNWKVNILLIIFGCIVGLIISEIMLRIIVKKENDQEYVLGKHWKYMVPIKLPEKIEHPNHQKVIGKYRVYDPELGWNIGIKGENPPLYFSDLDGIRCEKGEESISHFPFGSKVDIIAIGDSFTHGSDVFFNETWPYVLGQITNKKVCNLGVFAYGIDQATMRYEKWSKRLKCKTVILGLVAINFQRTLNIVRGLVFMNMNQLKTKPRYQFQGDMVKKINVPALAGNDLLKELKKGRQSELLALDPFMHPYLFENSLFDMFYLHRLIRSGLVWRYRRKNNPSIEDLLKSGIWFDTNLLVLKHLNDLVKQNKAKLLVAIIAEGDGFKAQDKNVDLWKNVIAALDNMNIQYINVSSKLYSYWKKNPAEIVRGNHYTSYGNRLIAEELSTIVCMNDEGDEEE